jgi:hypothetical protein
MERAEKQQAVREQNAFARCAARAAQLAEQQQTVRKWNASADAPLSPGVSPLKGFTL